jgi:hypothetical protein
MEELMMRLE